ncbi:hypothetical protein K3740_04515 [Ruegeria conchae]|uniref:hypothetical protein n=1 Tax=Ruegeria conchae TaxID=981384 RepID=UPI0021A91035|nr:hypothetical protein [Ruegeria conchae]UWR03969.1 hypothetical protein K3740_04515 [Ruegeria conchae]
MSSKKAVQTLAALWFVGACTETTAISSDSQAGALSRVPDAVAQIAAPGQDLNAVKIMPEDGCYWYRYVGPVETTFLPLRTIDGRPICTRA